MNSNANLRSNEFICQQCGSGALAQDKFCRRCGVRHAMLFGENVTALLAPTRALDETARLATAPLPIYHAVSAPLVKALTGNLATQPLGRTQSRWIKGLLAALISLSVIRLTYGKQQRRFCYEIHAADLSGRKCHERHRARTMLRQIGAPGP